MLVKVLIGVASVTVVALTPAQEQALLYRTIPLQALAYFGTEVGTLVDANVTREVTRFSSSSTSRAAIEMEVAATVTVTMEMEVSVSVAPMTEVGMFVICAMVVVVKYEVAVVG